MNVERCRTKFSKVENMLDALGFLRTARDGEEDGMKTKDGCEIPRKKRRDSMMYADYRARCQTKKSHMRGNCTTRKMSKKSQDHDSADSDMRRDKEQ